MPLLTGCADFRHPQPGSTSNGCAWTFGVPSGAIPLFSGTAGEDKRRMALTSWGIPPWTASTAERQPPIQATTPAPTPSANASGEYRRVSKRANAVVARRLKNPT